MSNHEKQEYQTNVEHQKKCLNISLKILWGNEALRYHFVCILNVLLGLVSLLFHIKNRCNKRTDFYSKELIKALTRIYRAVKFKPERY